MPVSYNIAANQRLPDPQAALKGKAIRSGIASQELERELAPQKIEIEQKKADTAGQNVELRRQELARSIAEDNAKLTEEQRKQQQEIWAAAKQAFEATGDEEKALQAMSVKAQTFGGELPEEAFYNDEIADAVLSDYDTYLKGQDDGVENPFTKINPKDYTQESIATFQKTRDFSDLVRAAPVGSGESAKEAEIAEYEAQGETHEDAVKLAYDKITIKENTKTGMMVRTDQVTGEVTEIPVANVPNVDPKPEPGKTLWYLKEFATGPINAGVRGFAIPAAWMGMSVGTKSVKAKQTFTDTTQAFIRAMALSERYAVGEQDRIREDMAMLPKVLDDPILMGVRMIALDDDLALRQAQAENDSNDTSLNSDIRQEAAGAANRIKNYRAVMGVPPRVKSKEELDALPSGTEYIAPDGEIWVKN